MILSEKALNKPRLNPGQELLKQISVDKSTP